jgi:hypothetical protein
MMRAHLAALVFHQDDSRLGVWSSVAFVGVHLIGWIAFWRLLNQPMWWAAPTLIALLALPLIAFRSRGALAVETLAPLFFLYAILIVRYMAVRVVNAPVPYQDESTLANARVLAFQIELAAIAACAYVFLAQVARLMRARALIACAIFLSIAAFTWYGAETITHRTRGVTGSDPYAYAQMAIDLAMRGTPLHRFEIFSSIASLGITWYPVVHVGYELPINNQGDAATVWPIGGAVWIAGMFRAFGEPGIYLATPIAGLLSLLVLAFLVWETVWAKHASPIQRIAIVSISVALLATSWEQVDRSLVPLVDVQAQLWTMLAMWLTMRAARSKRVVMFGIAAGFALAIAYWVRHTQVFLALAMMVAAFEIPRAMRWRFLISAALAALVVAIPDLWYHHVYFGGWLTPESKELALFSVASVGSSAATLSERFFGGNEFGYLFPFLLYGVYRFARENQIRFFALATWVVVLVAFHVPYVAIRMRDLLPEFPPLIFFTAYGIVTLAVDLSSRTKQRNLQNREGIASQTALAMTGLVVFLALLLFLTRTQFTLMRLVQPAKVTFGYITQAQRASFDQLITLTPSNAVIASVMNDGAIDLYAHRTTVRLGDWNADEQIQFIEAMRRENRPVYLLDDGAETSATRRALLSKYIFHPITTLDVPLFGIVNGTPGMLWRIDE